MNPVLVLGCKGTLGSQLMKIIPAAVGWDREDVDVMDEERLRGKVAALGFVPGAIVNCVAFNDVDGAEDRPDAAFALNGELPGRLARYAGELGVPLVHYSTNYVFDGAAGEYAEDAAPSPLSIYGKSKLSGEQQVAANGDRWYVLRTAVIFGAKGASELSKKSFVDIMLGLAATRRAVQAVSDEINSVTYAPDLAAATCAVLESNPPSGIYHAVNSGSASWYDFAREIFGATGLATEAQPVSSTQFPRKAPRPPKAVLLNSKLPPFRPWQAALREFLRNR